MIEQPTEPEGGGGNAVARPRLDAILDTSFLMEEPGALLVKLHEVAARGIIDLHVVIPVEVQAEIAGHFHNVDKAGDAKRARGWIVWLLKALGDKIEEVKLETPKVPPGWASEMGPLGPDSPVDRGIIAEALRRHDAGQCVGIATRDGGIAIAIRRLAAAKRADILEGNEILAWAENMSRAYADGPSELVLRLGQQAEARGEFQPARAMSARALVLAAAEAEKLRLDDEAGRQVEEAKALHVRRAAEQAAADAVQVKAERTRKTVSTIAALVGVVCLIAFVYCITPWWVFVLLLLVAAMAGFAWWLYKIAHS